MIINDRETFEVFKQMIDDARKELPNYNMYNGDKIIKENILPLIDENSPLPFEYDDFYLERLETFKLVINDNMSFDSISKVLKNMTYVLDVARNLEKFELDYNNYNDPSTILGGINPFLYHISDTIKTFSVKSISIRDIEPAFFVRKFDLADVNLNDTLINDINLLRNIRPTAMITLENDDLFVTDHKQELLDFGIKENRKLSVKTSYGYAQDTCKQINDILKFFNPNAYSELNNDFIHQISLSTLVQNHDYITDNMHILNQRNFSSLADLVENNNLKRTIYINVDKDIDFRHLLTLNSISNKLNGIIKHNNLSTIAIGETKDVINTLDAGLDAEGVINQVEKIKDLNIKDLENKNIKYVSFKSDFGGYYQRKYYNAKELYKIQRKIHAIERKVMPFFLKQENISEKEIFTRLYLELGRTMEYDDNACALISKPDRTTKEDLKVKNSQNLTAGVLSKKTVCAGFADIIQRICADFNIEADFVAATNNKDEGHAWTRVKLDGKYYFVDLTWDLKNIKENKTPKLEYFLKSLADFKHEEFTNNPEKFQGKFDITKCECNESISRLEEKALISKANQTVFSYTFDKLNKFVNDMNGVLKTNNSKEAQNISITGEIKNTSPDNINNIDEIQKARKQQVLNDLNKELSRIEQLELENNRNLLEPTEININEINNENNPSNLNNSNNSNNSNVTRNLDDSRDDFDY